MRKPAFWQVFLIAATLWGGEYLRRDLWEPDEARCAYVAREMQEDGHWLVLYRNGEYYAHKPPLFYWLINTFSFLTHLPIGRLTARLPGFFAGLLALWATLRLAERWSGPGAGWPTVLTLFTTYLFWHEIGFGRIDALLLGLTMGALYFLFESDESPEWWRPVPAYLLMGLAVLAKGPVGLLVPIGSYVCARLVAGEGRFLRRFHWVWGPFLALSVPCAWLFLVWVQGAPEGYFHDLLFSQNVERVAGALGHRRPWYYYLGTVPVDLLPWTLCVPGAVIFMRAAPDRSVVMRRVLGWILFVVVMFSLSVSKRNVYMLSVFPAFAILVGAAWGHLSQSASVSARVARTGMALLVGLVPVVVVVAGFHPRVPIAAWTFWPIGLAALAGGIWMVRHLGGDRRFLAVVAVVMLTVQFLVGVLVYPAMNPLKTPVAMAQVVAERLGPGQPLLLYAMEGEIICLYARRRGQHIESPDQLDRAMSAQQKGMVVLSTRDYDQLKTQGRISGEPHPFGFGKKELVWIWFDLSREVGRQVR